MFCMCKLSKNRPFLRTGPHKHLPAGPLDPNAPKYYAYDQWKPFVAQGVAKKLGFRGTGREESNLRLEFFGVI